MATEIYEASQFWCSLNLDRKLNHLPEEERTVIKQLVEEFVGLFSDVLHG